MILKQVIRYTNADAIETTWVDANDAVIKCPAYRLTELSAMQTKLWVLGVIVPTGMVSCLV